MPAARICSKRSRMPSLTTSFSSTTPSTRASSETTSGVEPARATPSTMLDRARPGSCRRAPRRSARTASAAPLRSSRPSRSTPLMRVSAENGMKRARGGREVAVAEVEPLLGEDDDRAALGRLVGQRRELRGLGQLALGDARHRQEARGLAVAERDRAGLVEQQHRDVAGGLDGAARTWRARCGARGGSCRRCRSPRAARRWSSG